MHLVRGNRDQCSLSRVRRSQVIVCAGSSTDVGSIDPCSIQRSPAVAKQWSIVRATAISVGVYAVDIERARGAGLQLGHAGDGEVSSKASEQKIRYPILRAKSSRRPDIRNGQVLTIVKGRGSPILGTAAGGQIRRVRRRPCEQSKDFGSVI